MKVSLTDAGKRFNRDWIFRHFNYQFQSGQSYAITGPNGSGKSTLLQVIGGSMQPSEGKVVYENDAIKIADEKMFSNVSICAPYLDLIEEMTLIEFFNFHSHFKPWIATNTTEKIINQLELSGAKNKQLRHFSSGMKQRVKLAQAVFSDTSILMLDEPCTNLDSNGIALYHHLIHDYTKNRIVIVSSNDEVEYSFCGERIEMRNLALYS